MERLTGAPRFGQLTYASFDRGDGTGGGWHVHEQSADLSNAELEALRKHAATAFGEVAELPQFPTQDQVAAFPRRLSYFPLYSAASTQAQPQLLGHAFLHAAPAGLDATQRPGNVFSHLLIDRDAAATEHRPVELWRAVSFRAPYGPKSVLECTLPESADFERPGAYVTPAGVHNFIFDDAAHRLPVLAMLLDGARAAVNGTGPKIVLGTDSPDRAAFWIGAVSMLTTDEWARHLGWSVFERAADLPSVWSRGVHIAAVPRSDLAQLDASTLAIIDELGEEHTLGSFETTPPTPHRSAHGSSIESTAWADLVVYLLQVHPDRMPQIFERLDAIAALEYTPRGVPEWALAMATLPLGLTDVDEITQHTIVSSTPIEVTEVPWLTNDAVAAINRGSEAGTASAYERLMEATPDPRSLGYSLLYRGYLALALGDADWLQQHSPVPLPSGETPSLSDDETTHAAAVAALKAPIASLQIDSSRVEAAVRAIRIIDLLLRVRLLSAQPPQRGAAQGAIEIAALELLETLSQQVLRYEDRAAAALQHLGILAQETRVFIAIGAFGIFPTPAAGPAAFAQLPPSTLGWFSQQGMPNFVMRGEKRLESHSGDSAASTASTVHQLAFELVSHRSQQTNRLEHPYTLLFGSLERAAGVWSSIPSPLRDLLLPLLPQHLPMLTLAERHYPGQVPEQVIDQVLLQAPPSQELSALTQELNRSAHLSSIPANRDVELLHTRDSADQYRLNPQFSLQMHRQLQVLASKRFPAAGDASALPLPTAVPEALQSSPLPESLSQQSVLPEGPALNLDLYAPLIMAATAYNAITGKEEYTRPQQRLIVEARQSPHLETVVQAFTNFASRNPTLATQLTELLIERSLLAAGFNLPSTKVTQTISVTALDNLHMTSGRERKQDRPFTVYDAAVRELCASPDSPQSQLLISYRDRLADWVMQDAGENKESKKMATQLQKAIKKHFEGLEPRGGSLLGGLFKQNKNEGEN